MRPQVSERKNIEICVHALSFQIIAGHPPWAKTDMRRILKIEITMEDERKTLMVQGLGRFSK